MLAAITVLSLVTGSIAPPDAASLTQARPRDLVAELEQDDPDHVTLDARFRLDTGEPGALHVDIWDGEHPTVESEFSVGEVPHVWVHQTDGEEPESWLSPDIEADPELMLRYWAVMTDLRLYESTAKNPACKVTKWGLKALTWIAGVACCRLGGGIACGACTVGFGTVHETINGIDCNKECKPDCPIP